MRLFLLALFSLALMSCSTPVRVAAPTITNPSIEAKVPGKFAINLQRGGWELTAEATSWVCTAQEFEVPVDRPYETSIRKVIAEIFEQAEYVETALSADELAAGGYAGQVTIIQSGADAFFHVRNNFISYIATSEVRVNTVTAVSVQDRPQQQFTANGTGNSEMDLYVGCGVAGDAVAAAAQDAVQKLVNSMSAQLQTAVTQTGR